MGRNLLRYGAGSLDHLGGSSSSPKFDASERLRRLEAKLLDHLKSAKPMPQACPLCDAEALYVFDLGTDVGHRGSLRLNWSLRCYGCRFKFKHEVEWDDE